MGSNKNKEKYLEYLKKINFLIKYNDLNLYHGRCQTGNEKWRVLNNYDNSSKNDKDNIMGIPCLCVADYDVALSYAKGTSLGGRTGEMKVYKIVSLDDDALIVNERFNLNKLSDKEVSKFFLAIQSIVNNSVKSYFKSESGGEIVFKYLIKKFNGLKLISNKEKLDIFEELSNNCNVDGDLINKNIGIFNSNLLFQKLPQFTISSYIFDSDEKRDFLISGDNKYQINQEIVRYILDKNNIIAFNKKGRISDKDNIVYVFNLSKVQVSESIEDIEKE